MIRSLIKEKTMTLSAVTEKKNCFLLKEEVSLFVTARLTMAEKTMIQKAMTG